MDLTYRSDLRELADLQYARFDAKLEQRIASLDAKLEQQLARLERDLRTDMADLRADMIKWMFVFWLGSVAAVFLSRPL